MERLQKLIAASGICSRRQAEELIVQGKVMLNGVIVTTLGTQADPTVDSIKVGGRPLPHKETVVYLLNKPKGYVSTRIPQGRQPVVTELVPNDPPVYPVGRLDKASEGLLLLTNDGELSAKLTHPRYGHSKTYYLHTKWQSADHRPLEWAVRQLEGGVKLGDGKAKGDSVSASERPDGSIRLEITVHEGRNHLLRRMCATVGMDVTSLRRTKFATLSLDRLKPGLWRQLTQQEIESLRAS